jgi:predicted transcriptional regulator
MIRSIYFKDELFKELKKVAEKEERSVNWIVNKAVKNYLKKNENNENKA